MTNEQLALVLTLYQKQLVAIFDKLSDNLKEQTNLECHMIKVQGKWIGDPDKEPKPGQWYINNPFVLYDENYEWLDRKGDPVILDELKNFIDNLDDEIEEL